jgi:tetratricopeptide (TPR) repeat protein
MKKRILLIAALVVVFLNAALPCYAGRKVAMGKDEIEGHFNQGNAYYEKGDFAKAAEEYGKVVSTGYASGPLYYNLGNAFFKTGDLAHAMLNYKRAKRLIPRDSDLLANYNYARTMIKGNPPAERGLWAWKPLRSYSGRFTVNELLLMSSAFYAAAMVLLLCLLYLPSLGRYILPAAALLLFLALLNSAVTWRSARVIGKLAVVTASEAESKFGPFDSATKFFTLYEGKDINVLEYDKDWCKVRRSDGKVGWVKAGTIEII